MKKENTVYIVYDGECPLCSSATQALRLKKGVSDLHLINAREKLHDPLILEINQRDLDLDEGMVVYAAKKFYHGKNALKYLAHHGITDNVFINLCKNLFCSDLIASITYPCMRGIRNWLLYKNNVKKIDNLNLKK